MTDEIPMITIGRPNKSNLDKLPEVFKKLEIIGVNERISLEKILENHPNSYGIIELLDELGNMRYCNDTHENRFKIYCINRDLKQLNSPLYGENLLTHQDINRLSYEEQVTCEDIIEMHIELRHKQGREGEYLNLYPTKRNIIIILSNLVSNDIICSYSLADLFIDIFDNEEWDELLPEDQLIPVLKIL